ncbi:hypothetical protein BDN70DRAFT_875690 [Pholiota conissans]|uniref:Uncharacterized protein n=1 Tax=Pholiota conissans TaxID=109636 RepID=A0A9P5Z6B1_9AGAR|nr:hypothetical protein BDN70DRAFT_875690 [Pholiota conissans]
MHTHTNARRHTPLLSVYIPSGVLAPSLSVPITSYASPPGQNDAASASTANPPLATHARPRNIKNTQRARRNKRYPAFSFCLLLRRLPYSLFPISIYTLSRPGSLAQSMHHRIYPREAPTPSVYLVISSSGPSLVAACYVAHRRRQSALVPSSCERMTPFPPEGLLPLSFFIFLARASLCVFRNALL